MLKYRNVEIIYYNNRNYYLLTVFYILLYNKKKIYILKSEIITEINFLKNNLDHF